MASQEKQEEEAGGPQPVGWTKAIQRRYHLTKKDIESYPYVWALALYGVVYGGLGLWLAYRWRNLPQLEGRVQLLQGKMCQRVREAEAAKSAAKASSGRSTTTAKPDESASLANCISAKSSQGSKSSSQLYSYSISSFISEECWPGLICN